jgi:hypothetical protein
MSEWALKVGSVVTTLLVLVSGYGYASTHVKNPNAPLQPPVEKSPEAIQATPTPTAIPSLVGNRRGQQPRVTSSPAPRLTLQPGVQATELPEVTFTHTS